MRETIHLLFPLLFLFSHSARGDLLSIPSVTFKVSRNAQEGDLILGTENIRASEDLDESLNLELEGTNPSPIAINGSIIDAGQLVNFVLVNKNAFENGKSKVKLQAIGVISGKVQEETINFVVESSSDLPQIPEIPNFVVNSDFQSKESTVVRVSGPIPPESEIVVLGSYAERVSATFQEDNIILDTVPCSVDSECDVSFPFTVILVLRNGENHVETLVTFEQEKKSSLKMIQKQYETVIEEHTGEQERLVKVTAKGAASEVLYSLRDSSGLFSIHPKEGILSVLHPEFLTRNSLGDTVNLTVVATDGSSTADAEILVKIVPEVEKNVIFGFEKDLYEITAENTNPVVGIIKAKSSSPVTYHITEGRSDLYVVEPNGELKYTGKLGKADRDDEITVAVRQGGLKITSAKVHIILHGIGSNPVTASDDGESIEIISSAEPKGVVVTSLQFHDDDQDAKLEYQLIQEDEVDENGNLLDSETTPLFEVKPEGNVAHLIISGDLEKSAISTARIKIIARDAAHPREPNVTVTRLVVIQREKATEPVMGLHLIPLPPNIVLPYDTPIGTSVYPVTVLPVKSHRKYSVDPAHLFEITDSGLIKTLKMLTGEAENVIIRVTVEDDITKETISAQSTVKLQKIQKPHFVEDRYDIILSDFPQNTDPLVTVSAVNEHSEPVKAFFLKGGHSKYFGVSDNGILKMSGEPLAERYTEFDLLVAISEAPAVSVPVHISIQKPRPQNITLEENQIFATVFDNLPLNSYVAKVDVKNSENVVFEMASEEKGLMNLFAIEEDGTIRSKDWLAGSEGMHKFSVLASTLDQAGVRSATATVIIDVIKSNECAPKFKKEDNLIFYVRENTPKDTIIGKVSAEILPAKCDLEYQIIGENSGILTINSANGELKTNQNFDFEKQKSYQITLKLLAGKHNSIESESELRILDEDDHPLKFDILEETVEVSEDAPLNTVIATVRATDGDVTQPVFYHLKRGSAPQFSLDSRTGKVMVDKKLDREEEAEFLIEIGALNHDNLNDMAFGDKDPQSNRNPEAVKRIRVKISDVNDNAPQFARPQYYSVISKDTVVGSALLEVGAYDPDISDEGHKLEYTVSASSFEYRGMSRNVEDVVDIRTNAPSIDNPTVYLSKPLTDYVGGVFNIQLQVRDTVDGTIGKAGLSIYVHDSSDLISLELPYSPSTVSQAVVEEVTENLSNATSGLLAIPKSVYYKAPHGIMLTNSVDLQVVFFNKTMSEIVPAERILAMQEMKKLDGSQQKNFPILSKPSLPYPTSSESRSDTFIQPELFFIVLGFLILLMITLALCGMMACFARSKFLREKKIVENEIAIKDALHFPSNRSPPLVSFKHFAPPTAEMYRNHEEHMYRSPNLNEKIGSYAVQQATITVPEHEEKI